MRVDARLVEEGIGVCRYRYNGMEISEDLGGIYTAFYRSYDPSIGRWMQIDPMAEKYPGMSPYNGMGNNPILYSDPMRDTLVPAGSATALNALQSIIFEGTGGHYTSTINSDGQIELESVENSGSMTSDQEAFVSTLQSAISSDGTININVVDHSDAESTSVVIGDSGTSPNSANPGSHTIDVGDMQAAGTDGLVTAKSMLAHEVAEGNAMQVGGKSAGAAHTVDARAAESRATGYGVGMTTATTNARGQITGMTVPVTRGFNNVQKVQITVVNGQVTSLKNNKR